MKDKYSMKKTTKSEPVAPLPEPDLSRAAVIKLINSVYDAQDKRASEHISANDSLQSLLNDERRRANHYQGELATREQSLYFVSKTLIVSAFANVALIISIVVILFTR